MTKDEVKRAVDYYDDFGELPDWVGKLPEEDRRAIARIIRSIIRRALRRIGRWFEKRFG